MSASQSPRFSALPLAAIRPAGWLARQLRIQADGLSGHLDEVWRDVGRSKWIGGDAEGWERAPYWLDGLIPLAFLLGDEWLTEKAHRWVGFILDNQHGDGWLGPRADQNDSSGAHEMDPWPIFVILKALAQYAEVTDDARVAPAMLRAVLAVDRQIGTEPLASWAKMRWADLVWSVNWLYERTDDSRLSGVVGRLRAQGYDWRSHFRDFQFTERASEWLMENHVVNTAMALKWPAVTARWGDSSAAEALGAIDTLDRWHGQATGLFAGDESLAGRMPSQGTELCAVVEYLFSLECLVEEFGEVVFADRLERIAYNALPAAFSPDMWAHQYDQQANQAVCRIADGEVVYTNNGRDANIFGLEPNFGCCTANMHQGWPKLASHLWMRTSDDGLAAIAYAPCMVSLTGAGGDVTLDVRTDYPFRDSVEITVACDRPTRLPLTLRMPSWTAAPTARVNREPAVEGEPGSWLRLNREWRNGDRITLTLPAAPTVRTGWNDAVTLLRGPLVYALRPGEEWTQVRGQPPAADWEVWPTTPWNYAIRLDPAAPAAGVRFEERPVGTTPFSPEGAPVVAHARGSRVSEWNIERSAAAPPPEGPVSAAEPIEDIEMVPYGCTNLRITEMPRLSA